MAADFETHSFRVAGEELEQFFADFQKPLKNLRKRYSTCFAVRKIRSDTASGNAPDKKTQKS